MKDLVGKKFGRLTAMILPEKQLCRDKKWLCKCECGNEVLVAGYNLTNGNTKSCGCLRKEISGRRARELFRHNLIGKRFGRWLVIGDAGSTKLNHSIWLCRCDCGTEKTVVGQTLVRGDSKSCGCITMGLLKNSKTHPAWRGGLSFEPYCDIWNDKEYAKDILERDGYVCQNPDCWGSSKRLHRHHIDYNKKKL